MSFDFIEGFDYYPSNINEPGVGLAATWIVRGPFSITTLEGGRFGGQSLKFTPDFESVSRVRVIPASNKKVVGLAIRVQELGINNSGIGEKFLTLEATSGALLLELRINNIGEARLVINNTVLGVAPRPVLANTWHYYEIEFFCSNSGRCRFIMDGQEQFEFIGDTLLGVDDQITRISNWADAGDSARNWDDLYVLSNEDDSLGESRIQLLEPISDSTVVWTRLSGAANFEMVDEASSDGDSTYNFTNTVNATDLFGMSQITVEPDVIHAVGTVMAARKEDSGTRTIQNVIQSSGSNSALPTNNLTTDYIWTRDIQVLDPQGDVAWSKTRVNAMKVGYKLIL